MIQAHTAPYRCARAAARRRGKSAAGACTGSRRRARMPSSVRLANLKKISSSVLLGDWFQHPYGRRKGDWEEKKREYDGRWWTPRGQNPWAWAFGTP